MKWSLSLALLLREQAAVTGARFPSSSLAFSTPQRNGRRSSQPETDKSQKSRLSPLSSYYNLRDEEQDEFGNPNWYKEDFTHFDNFDGYVPRESSSRNRPSQPKRHEYERDYEADNSRVNMDVVDYLLSMREKARKKGHFKEADAMRDELLQDHGVLVRDKDKKWRSGCSASGSGQKWLKGESEVEAREREPPKSDTPRRVISRDDTRPASERQRNPPSKKSAIRESPREGPRFSQTSRPSADMTPPSRTPAADVPNDPPKKESTADTSEVAPMGYTRSPFAGDNISSLSDEEIGSLIAARSVHQANNEFDRAEAISDQLAEAGVNVHDGLMEWRADGQGFGAGDIDTATNWSDIQQDSASANGGSYVLNQFDYHMARGSHGNVSSLTDEEIYELLAQRSQCKLDRDFSRADEIKAQLHEAGVRIDDRSQEWRADGLDFEGNSIWQARPKERQQKSSESSSPPEFPLDEDPLSESDPPPQSFSSRRKRQREGEYVMAPDAGDNQSELSEEEILRLLARRSKYTREKDFKRADEIHMKLFMAGVNVDDRKGLWRGDGMEFGNVRDPISGNRLQPSRGERGSRKIEERRQQEAMDAKQREIRANGHDYSLAPDAGPNTSRLTESEIHNLIRRMAKLKRQRNFPSADSIQRQLFQAGVDIHDAKKEWRADGKGFEMTSRADDPRVDERNRPYSMSSKSKETEKKDEIEAIVEQRNKAKRRRDFLAADDLRAQLRDRFDVEVNDKVREWSVGGEFEHQKPLRPYRMARGFPPPENKDKVEELLQLRDRARAAGDFTKADEVLDELVDLDIIVDERNREWSMEVDEDIPLPPRREIPPYQLRGRCSLSEEDKGFVARLIEERGKFERDKRYSKADQIRDRLRNQFNVLVDDVRREWFMTGGYTMSRDPKVEFDEVTVDTIQQMIYNRDMAKRARDFDTADSIEKSLKDLYDVAVDDRTQSWVVGQPEPRLTDDGDRPRLPDSKGNIEENGTKRLQFQTDSSRIPGGRYKEDENVRIPSSYKHRSRVDYSQGENKQNRPSHGESRPYYPIKSHGIVDVEVVRSAEDQHHELAVDDAKSKEDTAVPEKLHDEPNTEATAHVSPPANGARASTAKDTQVPGSAFPVQDPEAGDESPVPPPANGVKADVDMYAAIARLQDEGQSSYDEQKAQKDSNSNDEEL